MQNIGKKWGTNEINFLKENYGKLSPLEIAKKLARTYQGVATKAQKLGLTKRYHFVGRKRWTQEEIITLKKLYQEGDANKLSEMLGRTASSIYAKAYELGLKIRPSPKIWTAKDVELLMKHFPSATSKEEMLILFPNRTWDAIRHKAYNIRLFRPLIGFKPPKPSPLIEDRLTDFQKGYLAGIIDGEGTIGIYKYKATRHPLAEVSVSNTDRGLVEYVQTLMGGNIYAGRGKKSTKTLYWLKTNNLRTVKAIVEAILPHLKSEDKLGKANLVLKYCGIRLHHHQNSPLTEEEEKILKRYKEEYKRRTK